MLDFYLILISILINRSGLKIDWIFSVDLDITGSPLKAGFDPNEVFDDSIDDLNFVRKTSKSPVYRYLLINWFNDNLGLILK